jgi:hypothetical protein
MYGENYYYLDQTLPVLGMKSGCIVLSQEVLIKITYRAAYS